MQVVNNIEFSPSLLQCQRQKIKSFFANKLKGMGLNLDNFDMQLQTLVKYQQIENGKLNLKFDLKNKNKEFHSERCISDNDIFVPIGYALGFVKTTETENGRYEAIENQPIYYFPSKRVFTYTAPNVTISQAKALESLYYSTLNVVVSNDFTTKNFDTRNLKNIPLSEVDGEYYYAKGIYYPLTEFPILNGGNSIEVSFDVPTAETSSASGDPVTERTYAVFQAIGYNMSGLSEHYSRLGSKCVK